MNIYLEELLKNYNKYKTKINLLENYPEFNNQTELKFYSKIASDLKWLEYCIEQLEPEERNVIKEFYYNRKSVGGAAKVLHMAKTTIHNRKKKALINLEELFDI